MRISVGRPDCGSGEATSCDIYCARGFTRNGSVGDTGMFHCSLLFHLSKIDQPM
jgi:hypothetical protein